MATGTRGPGFSALERQQTLLLSITLLRKEYDFSKARRNPYAKRLKQSVTMRLDTATVEYFKGLAGELDVPYQTLINLYLRDCAITGRRPAMHWRPSRPDEARGQSR